MMKKVCATLIISISILLLLGFIYWKIHSNASDDSLPSSNNSSWDFLMFTQQWPISYCSIWSKKQGVSVDSCSFNKNKHAWTIHGIWPNFSNSSSHPAFCSPIPFNISHLESIKNELNERWTTTQKKTNNSVFWKHEWLKHGTCAMQIPQLDTELKYFTQGLEWNERYNLTNAFSSCSIYPSDSEEYQITDVVQCLKHSFNVLPQLKCIRDKVLGRDILEEVGFCVNKNLIFVNCSVFGASSTCNKKFLYPATVSPTSN